MTAAKAVFVVCVRNKLLCSLLFYVFITNRAVTPFHCSTVVEYSTHNPKIKGSNRDLTPGERKRAEKGFKLFCLRDNKVLEFPGISRH